MNKSISDFIMEQEQQSFVVEETPLDTAFMEMSIALNLLDAYTANDAIVEYCVENEIAISESFGEKVKGIGGKIAEGGKKVIDFIKAIVRNIVNALASDTIDKTIATIKERQRASEEALVWTFKLPDINALLDDVKSFTSFVAEGNWAQSEDEDADNATNWTQEIQDILGAADSLDAMKKRYSWEEKKDMTTDEFVAELRKLKDSKTAVKAKKILKDLDKANFKNVVDGKNKPNQLIKQIKKVANMFVKVYDGWIKELKKPLDTFNKDKVKGMSKEQKDERQEFLKDERNRKAKSVNEYYV